jgi:uncharacterized membrane protein YhaH (DUF805 family)
MIKIRSAFRRLARLFFSLDGRMNRYDFWKVIILNFVVTILLLKFLIIIIINTKFTTLSFIPIYLLSLYSIITALVRRMHDANVTTTRLLWGLVIPIYFAYAIIFYGLVRRYPGHNRWGPGPSASIPQHSAGTDLLKCGSDLMKDETGS